MLTRPFAKSYRVRTRRGRKIGINPTNDGFGRKGSVKLATVDGVIREGQAGALVGVQVRVLGEDAPLVNGDPIDGLASVQGSKIKGSRDVGISVGESHPLTKRLESFGESVRSRLGRRPHKVGAFITIWVVGLPNRVVFKPEPLVGSVITLISWMADEEVN